MRQRINDARLKAAEARDSAHHSTDIRLKDEWLRVARMWEEIAFEYDEVQRLQSRSSKGSG
jgi:hypothetical protein